MPVDREVSTVLVSMSNEAEAAMLVQALESRGIMARATGGLTSGFRAEVPGRVEVLVHSENLSKAREVLHELEKG